MSTPMTAILPLLPAFEEEEHNLRNFVLLRAEKYSVFLLQRLSRAEYERECATMSAALEKNAEIKRLHAAYKDAVDCTGYACPLMLTLIGIFVWAHFANEEGRAWQALRDAWWRAFDAQIARLNRTYAPRGLRFELGEDTCKRRSGKTSCDHKEMWLAVHILPPELIQLAAADVAASAAPSATAAMPVQTMPVAMHAHAPPAYSESTAAGVAPSTAHGVELVRVAPSPWPLPAAPASVTMAGSEGKAHL